MRIAILGLGIIGTAWAVNLHADGLALRTWNRTPKPSAPGLATDPATAVAGAEVVIIVVADPPAVSAVLDAALPGLASHSVVVQASTISPQSTRDFAQRVRATGAAYLDAPFTGSKPAAEARQTVFYIGGEVADLERARPALAPLSRAILHVGAVGTASALKLAMNVNIALVCAALSESLALARAAGLSDDTYFAALKLNASRSGVSDLKEPKLRVGDFSPQFSLKHMDKDLRLALQGAGDLPLPQLRQVMELYARGMAAGLGEEDFAGLARLR